ncbi:MAG: hypothetical protein ACRC1H_13555, partial [Caldilineaceae bacterium]
VELVQRFAVALAEKLAAAEKKYGYSDKWAESDWMDECRAKLVEHVAKGDPRDVAAYCAFLWHHGERTALAQPAQAAVLAEREACAKECERIVQQYRGEQGAHALERAATAIRLRSETDPQPARAVPVYLVATGMTHGGQEQYTRHDTLPALCDYETLYAAQPAQADERDAAPAVPDGFALVPRELTSENGAKYALIGETFDGHTVPWTAIKAVHRAVVKWATKIAAPEEK